MLVARNAVDVDVAASQYRLAASSVGPEIFLAEAGYSGVSIWPVSLSQPPKLTSGGAQLACDAEDMVRGSVDVSLPCVFREV